MIVWMPELRKSTPKVPRFYHDLRPDERFTTCGRPSFAHGHRLDEATAVELYKASRCRTCAGDNPRYGRDRFPSKVA